MPHQQGHMDGLCGVYSIVNAMSVVRADTRLESKELFEQIIKHLSRRDLSTIITSGMTIGVLYKIINDLIPRDIHRSRPFARRKNVTLPVVWNSMLAHLANRTTNIGAIIIGLSGVHDHWTVVTRIDGQTLFLEDSGGLQRLNYNRLTVGEPKGRRIHQLVPKDVVFLG